MRGFFNSFLAFAILVTGSFPASASAIDGGHGTYFFRYRHPDFATYTPPVPEAKDIAAYFVGGLGMPFSEKLPLKPEWEDDNWRLTPSSRLPTGIEFDPATKTFNGTPRAVTNKRVVNLEGYDSLGNFVADAKVTFDVHRIIGQSMKLDLYAHTGKYRLDEVQTPAGVAIQEWDIKSDNPPGIVMSGKYFEGVPTEAGKYPILQYALDYKKDIVATYWGTYLVEDGPTFNRPDDSSRLVPLPWTTNKVDFTVTAPGAFQVKRLIDPAKPARYYLEIDPQDGLPKGVSIVKQEARSIVLDGSVSVPYETGKIRFKAVDSDGAVGYSGWYTFGTTHPTLACGGSYQRAVYTGKALDTEVPAPRGTGGATITFTQVSGSLPSGLSLVDGRIVGTPLVAGEETSTNIRVDVTVSGQTTSTDCPLNFVVRPGSLDVVDRTPMQDMHVRVGSVYTGKAVVEGGIPDYALSFASGVTGFSFDGPSANTDEVGVSGTVAAAGPTKIGLVLSNGDGNSVDGELNFVGYEPLTIGDIPTVSIKRLDASTDWAVLPVDYSTVIPDVSGAVDYPIIELSNPSSLPVDITLTGDAITGATSAPAGNYGTQTVKVTDFEGSPVYSNEFNVVVLPRDEIAADAPSDPQFTVETAADQTSKPVTFTQPPGAEAFAVTYSISGPDLPAGITFDEDTGELTAKAVPFAQIGDHGPYTVTATDQEGSSDTSADFTIKVVDWPEPSATTAASWKGTVSGDVSVGETPTWLNIPGVVASDLRSFVDATTVIGGHQGVKFLSSDPVSPAGLTFDPLLGTFSGKPTEEYSGDVTVAFEDARGRDGTITIPLEVKEYPSVKMTESSYDLPRLSRADRLASPIAGIALDGFWNDATWSLDTRRGPALPSTPEDTDPLRVDPDTGMIIGFTRAAEGTRADGLVLKATSLGANGERLESWTKPFSLVVTKPEPMTLSYPVQDLTYRLVRDANTGSFVQSSGNPVIPPLPEVGGSYVGPLTYSIDLTAAVADGLTGTLGVNKDTGLLTGFPDRLSYPKTPRAWQVAVNVKDVEGRTPALPFTFNVSATLDGQVGATGGGERVLRQDERFSTQPIVPSNAVGSVVFAVSPAALPTGVTFSGATGSFNAGSAFSEPADKFEATVTGKDADDRGLAVSVPFSFKVLAPLDAELENVPSEAFAASQYGKVGNGGLDITLPVKLEHAIGTVSYGIDGDLPGQLVYRNYDAQGVFAGWSWTDETRSPHFLAPTLSEKDAAALMPMDALVFDTKTPSLRGRPSKTGLFDGITIVAYDDHAAAYEDPASPNRIAYNTDRTSELSIDVTPVQPLAFADTTGASLSAKQYSASAPVDIALPEVLNSVLSVRYEVEGDLPGTLAMAIVDAFGAVTGYDLDGVTVSASQLPPDAIVLDPSRGTIKGIPSRTGTFTFSVKATDAFTRPDGTARSGTYTITVEAAEPLAVSHTMDSETLYQFTSKPTAMAVAANAAYGRPVTWTKNSAALPAGISATEGASRVTYAGYPEETGSFAGIVWTARDAAGRQAASGQLDFVVEERQPLELVGSGPLGMVAGNPAPVFSISARNTAYGLPLDAGDWTLPAAGTLPDGIDAVVRNGKVELTGTTDEVGDFSVSVSARDSRGGTDTLDFTLSVLDPSEVLEVSAAPLSKTTKVGATANFIAKPASRTFGDLVWSSSDPSVKVDKDGNVKAVYASSGEKTATVKVTDATGRSGEVSVTVNVMEKVKAEYPLAINVDRDVSPDIAATVSNRLGTVTFEPVGNWPSGISVDAATGKIVGKATAARGNYVGLSVNAIDTFQVDGVTYTETSPSSVFALWIDGDDGGFALATTADPSGRIGWVANNQGDDLVVTAVNAAWGIEIPTAKWEVLRKENLPPGITATVSDGEVRIGGTATQTGTFTGVSVRATDALGNEAVRQLTFDVIPPGMEIALTVANVTTKVGVPFSMTSSVDPTTVYGQPRYYSYDIDGDPQTNVPGEFSSRLDIGLNSGIVTGAFPEEGEYGFDVYVTDATKRVVSKPVKVSVLPSLRIIVPVQVAADQGAALTRTITTDYKLGTVVWSKGSGNWPPGFDVNPTTGSIVAVSIDPVTGGKSNIVTSQAATYSGLKVKATDTFVSAGATLVDIQESNAFSIVVNPIDAMPVITTPTKTILGKQNTKITSWRPKVVDDLKGQTWNYAGTKYSLSHDITAFGLSFDENTGVISGTAHTPFIVPDMVVTVTSARGDSVSTNPFWIGVAPELPLAPAATEKTAYTTRAQVPWTADAPVFENYIGTLTYSLSGNPGLSFDRTTGRLFGTPTMAMVKTHTVSVVARDEFNRSGTLTYTLEVVFVDMTATLPNMAVYRGVAFTSPAPKLADERPGGDTFRMTGNIPDGLSIDPDTGIVSGTTNAPAGSYSVSIVHEDALSSVTKPFVIGISDGTSGHRYWRVSGYINSQYNFPIFEMSLDVAGGGNVIPLSSRKVGGAAAYDGDESTGANLVQNTKTVVATFDFAQPVDVKSFTATLGGGFKTTAYVFVEWSDNRASWTQAVTGSKYTRYGTDPDAIETKTWGW